MKYLHYFDFCFDLIHPVLSTTGDTNMIIHAIDIEDDRVRAAAWAYIEAAEECADERARTFDAGSEVTFGQVVQRENGLVFDVMGMAHGSYATMEVLISDGMPPGDTWGTWIWAFEEAGLIVKRDAGYQAIIDAADDAWGGSLMKTRDYTSGTGKPLRGGRGRAAANYTEQQDAGGAWRGRLESARPVRRPQLIEHSSAPAARVKYATYGFSPQLHFASVCFISVMSFSENGTSKSPLTRLR
jgi:hypothetical protein